MKRLLLVMVVGVLVVASISAVSAQEQPEQPAEPPVSQLMQLFSDTLGVDVETLQAALWEEGASMASVITANGGDVASIQALIINEIMTNHPDIDQTVVETHVMTMLYAEREALPEGMGPGGEGGPPPQGGPGGGQGGNPPQGGPGGAQVGNPPAGGEGGTPPDGMPGGAGVFLGRGNNLLSIVADADLLNVYEEVLKVALQDEGATLTSIIEAYGGDVATIQAAIISEILTIAPDADATQVTEFVTTMFSAENPQFGGGPGGPGGPGGQAPGQPGGSGG